MLAADQRFVRERLVPAEDAVEENDGVPAEIVSEMQELGRAITGIAAFS